MKLIKDNKIITSSKRAYEVVYKAKGYLPYDEKEEVIVKYNEVTKSEIINKLFEKNIKYDEKSTKQELFDLLGSD